MARPHSCTWLIQIFVITAGHLALLPNIMKVLWRSGRYYAKEDGQSRDSAEPFLFSMGISRSPRYKDNEWQQLRDRPQLKRPTPIKRYNSSKLIKRHLASIFLLNLIHFKIYCFNTTITIVIRYCIKNLHSTFPSILSVSSIFKRDHNTLTNVQVFFWRLGVPAKIRYAKNKIFSKS